MKYCIRYYSGVPTSLLKKVDEIELPFRLEDLELPNFLKEYSNQTIVLSEVNDIKKIERVNILYQKFQNIKIKIHFSDYEVLKEEIQKNNIPFFFAEAVVSWDSFFGIINSNPSDILISNELAFSFADVANIAHQKEIQVRAIPNYAQSSWDDMPNILKFFIRPEDTESYADSVDLFDFYTDDLTKQPVIYKIYTQQKWLGNLNELIFNFEEYCPNEYLIYSFGQIRKNCKKRCLQGKTCLLCINAHSSAAMY